MRGSRASPASKEGIDLALHDLKGKLLGSPVHGLLKGAFRLGIPVAAEIGIASPEAMAEDARRLVAMGMRTVKIRATQDIDPDVDRILHEAGLRAAQGPYSEHLMDLLLRLGMAALHVADLGIGPLIWVAQVP